ncbi:MAG: DUF2007 domain-containing protein [Thermoanaerobaculia bacterium]|nr:DUF2007 domain-containing protein [Thermoanaerobaculia bacterium]
MRHLYTAENPIDAHFVKGFLATAGIEAVVRGEHLFAIRGGVPMTEETLPSVWLVHEEQYDRARQILERLHARARLRLVKGESGLAEAPRSS